MRTSSSQHHFADKSIELDVTIFHAAVEDYGMIEWPSSECLASFLFQNRSQIVVQKKVLELGGGTSLPSLLCAKVGARHVIITDRHGAPGIEANVARACAANLIPPTTCKFIYLSWGHFDPAIIQCEEEGVDVVIAADCFYNSQDFEDLIATVSLFLGPHKLFIMTFHFRNNKHTIENILWEAGIECIFHRGPEDFQLSGTETNADVHLFVCVAKENWPEKASWLEQFPFLSSVPES